MSFILFFQYLGTHVPSLGAFLCTLVVVVVLCFVFYKLGRHSANKAWTYDVEHRSAMIAQDIRERWERRIAVLEERNKVLQSRAEQILPAFKALTDIAAHFVEQEKSGR